MQNTVEIRPLGRNKQVQKIIYIQKTIEDGYWTTEGIYSFDQIKSQVIRGEIPGSAMKDLQHWLAPKSEFMTDGEVLNMLFKKLK